MPTVVGELTLVSMAIFEVDADPSTGSGVAAAIGSLAIVDAGGLWQKLTSADTGWSLLSFEDQVQVVTANTSLVLGQTNTVVNSSSAVNITLFQAATALSTSAGVTRARPYTISNWGTGVVTVTAFSGDTIVGSPTAVLKFRYSSITLLPSSLGWSIN